MKSIISNKTMILSDETLESEFETINSQMKSFTETFEDYKSLLKVISRDYQKKLEKNCTTFVSGLEDTKRDNNTSGNSFESIYVALVNFIKNMALNYVNFVRQLSNQVNYTKTHLEFLKDTRAQMKKDFESQNKSYTKLKKEYKSAKEKADGIKAKLSEFQNDSAESQSFLILKNEYKFANKEVKCRYNNQQDCLNVFQVFIKTLATKRDQTFHKTVQGAYETIKMLGQSFSEMNSGLGKKFEQFLLPVIYDQTVKSEQQSQRSNSSLLQEIEQSNISGDQSIISQISMFLNLKEEDLSSLQRKQSSFHTSNSSRNKSHEKIQTSQQVPCKILNDSIVSTPKGSLDKVFSQKYLLLQNRENRPSNEAKAIKVDFQNQSRCQVERKHKESSFCVEQRPFQDSRRSSQSLRRMNVL